MDTPAALPQQTWYVVWFSLLAAAVSLVGGLLPLFQHRGIRGPWAVGIIVGVAGFQVANARRLFLRNHPGEVRTWMRPASHALYGTSLVFFIVAGWFAFHS